MFGGKKNNGGSGNAPSEHITAYLGRGTVFEGKLEFKGTAQISGVFRGEVSSSGLLVVGEQGEIKGRVAVGNLQTAGTMTGEIEATGKVTLLPTAKVHASITTGRMEVEEGAHFDGSVKMKRPS